MQLPHRSILVLLIVNMNTLPLSFQLIDDYIPSIFFIISKTCLNSVMFPINQAISKLAILGLFGDLVDFRVGVVVVV